MKTRVYAVEVDGQTMLTRVDKQNAIDNYYYFCDLNKTTHVKLVFEVETRPYEFEETTIMERTQ